MHTRFIRRFAVVLLLSVLGSARAEDQRLAGQKLVLRKRPVAEHLVLVARQGVLAPLPGSAEDPILVGGALEISNPHTGELARFATSARDWTVNATGTVYRFRNHLETGPGSEVRALVIKHRRQLRISTRALGITLDEEAQGALSVVVRTGTRRYCFLFGGKIGKDKPGRFAAYNAPAPSACPTAIVVASTTTTSRPPGTRPTSTSVTTSTTSSTTSPPPPVETTTTSTQPPTPTTSSTRPPAPTTSSTQPPTPTTSSTTATVAPPTSTSTSTSSSTTEPPPVSTTSSTSVVTTSTTTSTARPCGRRGNSCNGVCPLGLNCKTVLDVCGCFL